jgi:hypothetical protein
MRIYQDSNSPFQRIARHKKNYWPREITDFDWWGVYIFPASYWTIMLLQLFTQKVFYWENWSAKTAGEKDGGGGRVQK